MISIVAVDKNWGIGINNKMPWRIPDEQLFFKEKTYGGIVIMGRKTLESLPGGRPLKGRRNIVMTRNPDFKMDGVETAKTPEALFSLIHNEDPKKVFLIGGSQIYRLLIPYCKEAYITKVDGEYNVDAYHPNLDRDSDWQVTETLKEVVSPTGISYTIYVYENIFLNR